MLVETSSQPYSWSQVSHLGLQALVPVVETLGSWWISLHTVVHYPVFRMHALEVVHSGPQRKRMNRPKGPPRYLTVSVRCSSPWTLAVISLSPWSCRNVSQKIWSIFSDSSIAIGDMDLASSFLTVTTNREKCWKFSLAKTPSKTGREEGTICNRTASSASDHWVTHGSSW